MLRVPAISIIVAVYNAEHYLNRCIESLLSQTFTDFEVLLINDGSTDNSGVICDEYAKNDPRFKAFHRANHGVGSTRHFGLAQAKGEYTLHVDPDDWLDDNTLQALYDTACSQQADMVIIDFMEEYPDKSIRNCQQPTNCETRQVLSDVLTSKLQGGCCNKLIKRSCYADYNINFIEGLNWGEDTVTVVRLLQHPIRVSYCADTVYHYDFHSNTNSYTRFVTPNILEQREKSVRILLKIVNKEPYRNYVMARLLTVAYLAIRIDAYPAQEFRHRYGILQGQRIMNLVGHTFQEKFFVWIALSIGYQVAQTLMRVKLLYQKIFKRYK